MTVSPVMAMPPTDTPVTLASGVAVEVAPTITLAPLALMTAFGATYACTLRLTVEVDEAPAPVKRPTPTTAAVESELPVSVAWILRMVALMVVSPLA